MSATSPELVALDSIYGIEVAEGPASQSAALALLRPSLSIALTLHDKAARLSRLDPFSVAAAGAFSAAAALVTTASARCTLAPPPRDIDLKINGQGDMIYRCQHFPAHEWSLSGHALP